MKCKGKINNGKLQNLSSQQKQTAQQVTPREPTYWKNFM